MPKNQKKKAFTLTELLVVVVIIGVLAAIVLPKFNKVMETRKTTEAEEVMAAVRTEQERRCALDKPYIGNIDKLVTEQVLPQKSSKNYTYSLEETGMLASSKGNLSYELKMPSYADGRVCCEGADCNKLNKDYPHCDDLVQQSDYQVATNCAAELLPVIPSTPEGCSGNQPPDQVKDCECGQVTVSAYCEGNEWKYPPFPACVSKPADQTQSCTQGREGTLSRSAVCKDGKWTFDGTEYTGDCKYVFKLQYETGYAVTIWKWKAELHDGKYVYHIYDKQRYYAGGEPPVQTGPSAQNCTVQVRVPEGNVFLGEDAYITRGCSKYKHAYDMCEEHCDPATGVCDEEALCVDTSLGGGTGGDDSVEMWNNFYNTTPACAATCEGLSLRVPVSATTTTCYGHDVIQGSSCRPGSGTTTAATVGYLCLVDKNPITSYRIKRCVKADASL